MIDALLNFLPIGDWCKTIKSHGFKRYLKNTSWLFLAKIITMIISFFVAIFVARYLGPSNYGILSYVVSFVGLFSFVVSLGLDNILYRELVKTPHRSNDLLGTAFFLKLIGAISAVFLVFMSLIFIKNSQFINILVIIISLSFFFQSFNVISYYFQSKVSSKGLAIITIAVMSLLAMLKLTIIIFNKGLFYLSFILLLEPLLYAIGYVYIYYKDKGRIFSWNFNWKLAKSMLQDSWPLLFSAAFVVIYTRIDQVMLKIMMDNVSVGIYSVAALLSEYWYFIPIGISTSFFPAIVNAKSVDSKLYRKRLIGLVFLILSISLLVSTIIYLFSDSIINILYGEQFIAAAKVLRIYVWAGLGMSLGVVINSYLIIENKTKLYFIFSLISMVVNVVLNTLFIPRYGTIGAAYATLFSYSIIPLSIFFVNLKTKTPKTA